jgi:hypothetical protein
MHSSTAQKPLKILFELRTFSTFYSLPVWHLHQQTNFNVPHRIITPFINKVQQQILLQFNNLIEKLIFLQEIHSALPFEVGCEATNYRS